MVKSFVKVADYSLLLCLPTERWRRCKPCTFKVAAEALKVVIRLLQDFFCEWEDEEDIVERRWAFLLTGRCGYCCNDVSPGGRCLVGCQTVDYASAVWTQNLNGGRVGTAVKNLSLKLSQHLKHTNQGSRARFVNSWPICVILCQ